MALSVYSGTRTVVLFALLVLFRLQLDALEKDAKRHDGQLARRPLTGARARSKGGRGRGERERGDREERRGSGSGEEGDLGTVNRSSAVVGKVNGVSSRLASTVQALVLQGVEREDEDWEGRAMQLLLDIVEQHQDQLRASKQVRLG